jgi:hypothetical protein
VGQSDWLPMMMPTSISAMTLALFAHRQSGAL